MEEVPRVELLPSRAVLERSWRKKERVEAKSRDASSSSTLVDMVHAFLSLKIKQLVCDC